MPIRTDQNFYTNNAGDGMDLPIYELEEEKKLIAEATEEIKKDLLKKWHKIYLDAQIFPKKLNSLNPAAINSLLSFENSIFYNELAKRFNLSQAQRNNLPQIIWTACINKNWKELENLISTGLNVRQSRELAREIDQNILANIIKAQNESLAQSKITQKETNNVHMERLPIEEALKQYPEIGEQLIGEKQINLKTFPQPVRPSIKNWLSDYVFNVGISNRSSFVRGEYLFRSQNGRALSADEREKVSLILKSFEEKIPIDINVKLKLVSFSLPAAKKILNNQFQTSAAAQPTSQPKPISPAPQPPKNLLTTKNPITTVPAPTSLSKPFSNTPQPPKNFSTTKTPSEVAPGPIPSPKPIAQSFQSDAERLRAWRKDLPFPTQQKTNQAESDWSASNQTNIHFSSPQKLSVESSLPQQDDPFSIRKNPLYDNRPVSQSSGKRLLPKNVVDLRENN